MTPAYQLTAESANRIYDKNPKWNPKFIPIEKFTEGITVNSDGGFILRKNMTKEEFEKSMAESARIQSKLKNG